MTLFLLALFFFVVGSIPTGTVIARLKGVDLRSVGSGNIGATNVLRSMGRVPALLTLIGDVLKGVAAIIVSSRFFLNDPFQIGIVGLSAIAGHDFSLFLRFRGGKGVATSIGVLLAYSPLVAFITTGIWLVVVVTTRYSSLGAVVSFTVLPVTMYLLDPESGKVIISAAMTALLLLKHVANIQRLLAGTESKVGEKVR
ncbi:MAG TPA: glycerol-3-phosphate 1-O-acyltransferase PlsY [Thermodesulfovibrionales bacterium]|nr:glycerol-3-phosphate 1-O-acyltransferase PlsY [Thermodesulfovibrionales bacterium]